MLLKEERENKPGSFEELAALGFFSQYSSGIQIDLNVAWKKEKSANSAIMTATSRPRLLAVEEGHLCDHNCTLRSETNPNGGGYACPAAFTLPENRGLDSKSLASLHDVLVGICTTADGLKSLRSGFLKCLEDSGYPQEIIDGVARTSSLPEINLFGGNPEMHPHIHEIIAQLIQEGYSVTLTTTGKRFLMNPEFVRRIREYPPTRIALSADDLPLDEEEIRRLSEQSSSELRAEYKRIPPTAGQKQKAVEAISVLNLSRLDSGFPPIILNYVLHSKNIEYALEIMKLLGELFPNVQFNPYPAQQAFFWASPVLTRKQLGVLEQTVDVVIERHFTQLDSIVEFRVVPKLHYYLLLKAIFLAYPNYLEKASRILSGYGLWRCYKDPILTGRYLQIGARGEHPLYSTFIIDEKKLSPGGHPGCFWNSETITNAELTVWECTSQEVEGYLTREMQQLAEKAQKPCPGCGFPRLLFDEPSVLAGIADNTVLANYLALRQKYGRF